MSIYEYNDKGMWASAFTIDITENMNNCIQSYLGLSGNKFIKYIDEDGFEGNTEEYIKKLNFKEGQEELDFDEEWDNFCDCLFNEFDTGNNFYREVANWIDLSQEFNSKEMIYLIKMLNDYWLETTGDPFDLAEADEEKIWNCIAYAWIRARSDDIKAFVLKKIEEKFDEWLEEQKEDGDFPLTCDICYRNKPIETYAACCNNKKFCNSCYKKIQKKPCPFCRGEINHFVGDDEICNKQGFQDWLFKFKKNKPYIENKLISNCDKCNIEIRYRDTFKIFNSSYICKKCIDIKPVIVTEKKKIIKRISQTEETI